MGRLLTLVALVLLASCGDDTGPAAPQTRDDALKALGHCVPAQDGR